MLNRIRSPLLKAQWRSLSRIILVASAYLVTGKLAFTFAIVAKQVTAVWPPTGIALAALLVFGSRVWPGVALGAFLVNFLTNEPLLTACGIALGNTAEALLGAYLLRRVGFENSLERLRDVFGLIGFAALLSTTVSATIGVTSLYLGHVIPWSAIGSAWQVWWVGDAVGNLLVAPLLLTWTAKPHPDRKDWHFGEAAAYFLVLVSFSVILFASRLPIAAPEYQQKYLIFPILIWAWLRLDQRLTITAVFIASATALWGVSHAVGPFRIGTFHEQLLLLQVYIGIVAVTSLITGAVTAERRRVGKALREQEERLRMALDAARMGTWEYNIQTGEVDVSNNFESMHGLAPDSFGGTLEDYLKNIHPDDRPSAVSSIGHSIEQCAVHNIEYRIIRPDGIIRWMQDMGKVIIDKGGRAVRITGVCMDVTERKRFAERFMFAVEAAPNAMILINQDGRITLANLQAEALFHYKREELIGQPVEMLIPERYRNEHWQYRSKFFADPQTRPMGVGRDLYARSKDGREVPVEIGLNPLVTEEGAFVLASIIDISERKRAEDERTRLLESEQTARAEAEAASRAKDEFLAMVSHELRTPLNAMLGWTRMLRAGNLDEVKEAHALEVIERNAKSQVQLIEDLLDMSRIITGKLRLNVRPMDLSAIVETAVDTLRLAADAKGIQVDVVLDPRAYSISGDPDRIQQVVWNLLSNAIKFTPKGGQVQVRLERINSYIEITVSDNGRGIKPELLPYVFDRFRQADSSATRSHGGLGLGLAIVRHISELHGGSAHVYSRGEGQGATFSVTLPLIIVKETKRLPVKPAPRSFPATESQVPIECPLGLKGLQVLIVDDEEDTRILLMTILESCGVKVKAVGSAAEALDALEAFHPDVLVSDIQMPREDGFWLIRQVRARELQSGRRIPAVALTAHARVEDRIRALSSGYQIHLPKPVEPAELLNVVAALTNITPEPANGQSS